MSRSRRTLWQVFRAPLLLALLSVVGLVAALVGDSGKLDEGKADPVVLPDWAPPLAERASDEAMRDPDARASLLEHRTLPPDVMAALRAEARALKDALAEKMLENGGLLTEYPSGTMPDRENFPQRNRIVAGMGHNTGAMRQYRQLRDSWKNNEMLRPGFQ